MKVEKVAKNGEKGQNSQPLSPGPSNANAHRRVGHPGSGPACAAPGHDKSRDACGLCGELGHWRAECPHRVA